jgi:hypothetical protein
LQAVWGNIVKYAATALALTLLGPVPAVAQAFPVSTHQQIDCLMRAVPEETRLSSAHAYLEAAASLPVEPVYAAALNTCAKTHNWSDEQRGIAYEAMMYKTRTNELWERFDAIKVNSVLVSHVAEKLMFEKRSPLDRNWRKDVALEAHVRSLLAAEGIKDEETQRLGGYLLFALLTYTDRIDRWEARWPPPPFERPPTPAPPTLPPPRQ